MWLWHNYRMSIFKVRAIILPVLIVFAALLVLQGCGFHLRGSASLPFDLAPIQMTGLEAGHPLVQSFRERIRYLQEDNTDQKDIKTQVNITHEQWRKRPLSTGGDGRALEYELNYQIKFIVYDRAGSTLLPEQLVRVTRDYGFDASAALAKNVEEDMIKSDLYQETSLNILQRLASISHQ